jgi:hypothetical protein
VIAGPPGLAISEIAMIRSNIYVPDFKWSQLGTVARVGAVLAVDDIATMLHNVPFARFEWSQTRGVAGTQTDHTVRNILLVLGYRQTTTSGSLSLE